MANVPTILNDVANQVEKFWSPIFVDELKESAVLPSLVSSEYEGEIKQGGDTVYVSMIQNAAGRRQPIAADGSHRTIEAEKMATQRVAIAADQIFTASFEFDSLIDLQTQLAAPSGKSKIREALLSGVEKQINDYLYSLIAPSTTGPDHLINSVSNFDFSQLMNVRKLASKAQWMKNDWFMLLDPDYMNNFLTDQKNVSADYANDLPLVGGQKQLVRSGFSILEDNSAGMATQSTAGGAAIAFHKTFMYLVHQTAPTFKISDLHSGYKRGYLMTVDLVGGAKLGLQGAKKHIKVTSDA